MVESARWQESKTGLHQAGFTALLYVSFFRIQHPKHYLLSLPCFLSPCSLPSPPMRTACLRPSAPPCTAACTASHRSSCHRRRHALLAVEPPPLPQHCRLMRCTCCETRHRACLMLHRPHHRQACQRRRTAHRRTKKFPF